MARHTPWAAPAALAVAMAAAGVFLFTTGDGLTFYSDQWDVLVERRGHDLDVFLTEQNHHLMAVPIFVHKVLFEVFGAESYAPYQLAAIAVQLAIAGLFFAIVRRRVDDTIAVAFTVAVLFFGPGWEMLLSGVGMLNTISLAAGLGMLVALDVRTRRGDVAAAVLLTISVASFSYGLMFAAAAAVDIMLRPGGARRLWVAVLPLVLYGLWVLGWAGESDATSDNLPGLARSVADSASAVAVSLTGLYRPGGEWGLANPVDTTFGPPLAFALAAVVAHRLRGPARESPRLWAMVVLTLLLWVSIGLIQSEARPPTNSRYLYPGGVFVLLIVAELLKGMRVGRRGLAAVAVWLAIVLVAGVANFRSAGDSFRDLAAFNRAKLAALELARGTVSPDFRPANSANPLVADHYMYGTLAGPYFDAIDDYGSPAYSVPELERAPAEPRQAADLLLAEATRLAPSPASGRERGPEPPVLEADSSVVARRKRGCLRLAPRGEPPSQAVLTMPPGGLLAQGDQEAPLDLRLRRFADDFGVELGAIAGESWVAVAPPPDAAMNVPWRAQLNGIGAPLVVCGASQD